MERNQGAAERGTGVENTEFYAKYDRSDAEVCYKAPGHYISNNLIEEKVKRKRTQCYTGLLTDICRPRRRISVTQVRGAS